MRKSVVVITGAAGGMGKACARKFTDPDTLVLLVDLAQEPLQAVAEDLAAQGFPTSSLALDLSDPLSPQRIADRVAELGMFRALIHTAGVWNVQAAPEQIFNVNYTATFNILDALEPLLTRGSVAVCVASVGAHRRRGAAQADARMARNVPVTAAQLQAELGSAFTSTVAYGLSKRGVLVECERRAGAWGRQGARIVSISPGNIDTPMGRAGQKDGANMLVDAAIGSRSGSAEEVAELVDFLISEQAAYITGCDIRVDGGAVANLRFGGPDEKFEAWDSQLDVFQ